MKKAFYIFLYFISLISLPVSAQKPKKLNSSEIYMQIQKLNFLGSVLYIAAHPDDENTRLISFLSNDIKARTGYLSLTRGDGGQNLIGTELRELLGTIRTQELIEARKIDGGEQFFSRANDFGYSKTPTETLEIWDKNQVLSDLVWQIRTFQPDVIINRFDHRSPGTTHGHHTASAMLGVEGFNLSNNSNAFPDQLKLAKLWQPKRIFFNLSWWFYGSKEKFDAADKSTFMKFDIGSYFPLTGKSNQEIAALSRSCHQSQGFGSTGARGEEMEYLEPIIGDIPQDKTNIFEGVDTTWNRVKGGKSIGELVSKIQKNYNFTNPSQSIADLVKVYNLIQNLDESQWKSIKLEDTKKIIEACAGLFLEAVAEKNEIVFNEKIKIKIEAINRSSVSMELKDFSIFPLNINQNKNLILKLNNSNIFETIIQVPNNLPFTQPYWLQEESTVGMYRVDSQINIGKPDVIRELKVNFNLLINNVSIPFQKTIIFKINNEVKGETYKPLDIVPNATLSFVDKVLIFNGPYKKQVSVKVVSNTENFTGILKLNLNKNWNVQPENLTVKLLKKGEEQIFMFDVSPSKADEEIVVKAEILSNGVVYDKEKINIVYDHISNQQVLKPAIAKFLKVDLKIGNQKIAYIEGAGDEVPKYLTLMGYDVAILKPEAITAENLCFFDVVITGIRAYNTIEALANKQKILLDFVADGHTMIVQYNTTGKFVIKDFAPFPLKISHDRVTEENAEITFLAPKHPVLNFPNTITKNDFRGWVQEQGLYYPESWDKAYTPIISANDKGETPKNSAIIVANHAKGVYIYTGLSFFRELPAGVTGAYRLLANLIAAKQ